MYGTVLNIITFTKMWIMLNRFVNKHNSSFLIQIWFFECFLRIRAALLLPTYWCHVYPSCCMLLCHLLSKHWLQLEKPNTLCQTRPQVCRPCPRVRHTTPLCSSDPANVCQTPPLCSPNPASALTKPRLCSQTQLLTQLQHTHETSLACQTC